MSCCNNPKIQSSTYTDWCENCGWCASYLNGYVESQDDSCISNPYDEHTDDV